MIKKTIILLFMFSISLLFTGCWNYHELSDLAIISSVGIDKTEEGYKLSMLVSNTIDTSSSDNSTGKTTLLTGSGKTINNAVNDIKSKSSKDIYLGHLSLLLISEEVAKEEIYDIVEALLRDPESAKKVKLVLAKDVSANTLLKTLSPLDNFPSENILSNIDNSIQILGISYNTYLSNFIYKIINYGYDNIIPSVTLDGDTNKIDDPEEIKKVETDFNTKVSDIGIFKDYKLIDYANLNESKSINILTNKATSLTLSDRCYKDLDKYITIRINDPKTKIDLKLDNNNIKYIFSITAKAKIDETDCKLELRDNKIITNIENSMKSRIYEIVKETIDKTQNIKTDIFGLGNILYKKDYKLWKNLEYNWDEIYSNLDYKINIDLKLDKKGTLETTLKEEER